jgi:hypothetical protein
MIDPLLMSLIERHYRLNFFKNSKGCPKSIIDSAEKLYSSSLEEVKNGLNIDGEEYLNSITGQIEYIEVIQSNQSNSDMHDEQCGTCKKFQLKNDDFSCSLYDDERMGCPSYEDSGMNLCERIMMYIERCGKCLNSISIDECDLNCKIKDTNMFDCNCEFYKER